LLRRSAPTTLAKEKELERKTALISISVLVEVPSDVADDPDFNDLNKLENSLEKAVEDIESSFKVSWNSTETLILDPNTMNCGKCESCGCWVSDREKDGIIRQLVVGARVNGKLLCDECLPKDHHLAF
jgi:hypothetical protein